MRRSQLTAFTTARNGDPGDYEAEELSVAERRQWRKMLLVVGKARATRDLLYAPASAASRQPRPPRSVLFHHVAASHEMAFVVKGRAQVAIPQQVFTLAPGRLLVLEPGVYHAESPAEPNEEYCMCWCHCDRNRVLFNESRYLLPRRLEVTGVRLQGHTDAESIVSAVSAELSTRQPGYQRATHYLLGYLGLLLVRRLERGVVQRYRDSHAIAGDPRKWQHVERALEFCRENFRDDIKVTDVANAVGLGSEQLGRLVTSHLGTSLSRYLRDLRVAEAKSLLTQSGLRVCDVARALGYAYPEHFTRAFARATGLSPTAYRQHRAGG